MKRSLLIIALVFVYQSRNTQLQAEEFVFDKPMKMRVVSYRGWEDSQAMEKVQNDQAFVTLTNSEVQFDVCGQLNFNYTAEPNHMFERSPVTTQNNCQDDNELSNAYDLLVGELQSERNQLQMVKIKSFDKVWVSWRTFDVGSQMEAGMVGVAVQQEQ